MNSFSLFISLRYLRSGSDNRYFSWISILSMLGISIGVATMIVVLSVINGFESELTSRFLNANAHIMLYRYPSGLKNPEEMIASIGKDFSKDITGASPFIHFETMSKKGGLVHSVLVRGIDPMRREKVQSLKPWLSHPESLQQLYDYKLTDTDEPRPAIVGEGVAKILDIKVGDTFEMISPSEEAGSVVKPYRLTSIYLSGLKTYDNRLVVLNIESAAELIQLEDRVTGIEIGLVKPYDSPTIADAMSERYNISTRQWQSYNENLMKALQNERAIIFLVICLVGVVASFNILTTLFVAVTLKQKQISIMKALGASHLQILRVFLIQGALMGAIGALLGVGLAYGICKTLQTYQFIDLPDPYYLTHLPVEYSPVLYLVLASIGVLISVFASILPAVSAARVVPIVGLKMGNQLG